MKAAESPIRSTLPTESARGFSLSYLLTMVVGAFGVVVLFGVALVLLDGAGRLPPPQLANNLCVDEKLRFLRASPRFDAPGFAPQILGVGSSVTWRTLDGEAVEHATGGRARFFNGGFCGLKVNETAFTTRYFLERYPGVREVVTILAPQDLTECRATDPRIFDAADVDRYVYGDAWVFPLYLKYFDPFTFVKNVLLIASKEMFRWDGGFDRFASLPMDTTDRPDKLVYGRLEAFDPACLEALRGLAKELHAGGRRLIVGMMPLHPDWIQRYDPQKRVMQQFERGIRDALAGTSAIVWGPGTGYALRPDDFVDAIHIRWSAARNFSRALVHETGLGQASLGMSRGQTPPVIRN